MCVRTSLQFGFSGGATHTDKIHRLTRVTARGLHLPRQALLRVFPLDFAVFGIHGGGQGRADVCSGGGGRASWELGYVVQPQRLLRSLIDAHAHRIGMQQVCASQHCDALVCVCVRRRVGVCVFVCVCARGRADAKRMGTVPCENGSPCAWVGALIGVDGKCVRAECPIYCCTGLFYCCIDVQSACWPLRTRMRCRT